MFPGMKKSSIKVLFNLQWTLQQSPILNTLTTCAFCLKEEVTQQIKSKSTKGTFLNGLSPAYFSIIYITFSQFYTLQLLTLVGFEFGLSQQKENTLTTRPQPRPYQIYLFVHNKTALTKLVYFGPYFSSVQQISSIILNDAFPVEERCFSYSVRGRTIVTGLKSDCHCHHHSALLCPIF